MAKRFKCPKCSRSFAMAAHLARHVNTIHSPGGARKAGTAKRAGRRPGRPPARMAAVAASGGADRILNELRAFHSELAAQQEALNGQLVAVAGAIEAMGATPAAPTRAITAGPAPSRRGPGRPKGTSGRPGSLKDFMARVLRQTTRPLSPREIASNIVKAGYKTKAKDLTKAVSNALPQVKGIKKVGFGQYRI